MMMMMKTIPWTRYNQGISNSLHLLNFNHHKKNYRSLRLCSPRRTNPTPPTPLQYQTHIPQNRFQKFLKQPNPSNHLFLQVHLDHINVDPQEEAVGVAVVQKQELLLVVEAVVEMFHQINNFRLPLTQIVHQTWVVLHVEDEVVHLIPIPIPIITITIIII
jgi:hypothetical protein